MAVDYTKFVGYVSCCTPFYQADPIRKPFEVVSHLGIRYTGIFDHIDQVAQTICLGSGELIHTENE
jgi:hypothetical protein